MDCAKKPLVSVIMPAYNASQYIAKSISSVQAQTFTNWELIVVDDYSSDNTVEIVNGFLRDDSRIRLYRNAQNMGVAKSRNRALEQCQGDYVAFLDSDDIWYSDKIELQLQCFSQTNAELVYTSYAIVDSDGIKLCSDFIVPRNASFSDLLKQNVCNSSTVMISRNIAVSNRFIEDYYHEDYIYWINLAKSGCKIIGIQKVLADYVIHKDSKSANKFNSAKKRWQIYRKYLGLSLVKSSWYFAHYAFAGLKKYKTVK
ncbi:MAG: glycosyltransferase [Oscillospiraceae bacterium]|nr:glycosyltransferase [Oscillospiraceae bacterium]